MEDSDYNELFKRYSRLLHRHLVAFEWFTQEFYTYNISKGDPVDRLKEEFNKYYENRES